MKIIDFSDIDMYPESYWCETKKGKRTYWFSSFVIEKVSQQQATLISKKSKLMLGDAIRIHLKFGHNLSSKHAKEYWVDAWATGDFEVTEISPRPESDEIVLGVRRLKNSDSKFLVLEM